MEALVLADIVPFLPSALKKVPWQVRTLLISAMTVYAAFLVLSWIFHWPMSTEALKIFGALAGVAGLPALGNIQVGGTVTKEGVTNDLTALTQAIMDEIHKAGAPVVHVNLGGDVNKVADAIAKDAPVVAAAVDTMDPAAAPVVAEVEHVSTEVSGIAQEVADAVQAPAPTVPVVDPASSGGMISTTPPG